MAEFDYRMRIFSAPLPENAQAVPTVPEEIEFKTVVSRPTRLVGRRNVRQAKRMSTALLHQTAELNSLLKDEGEVPALWTAVNAPVNTHWQSLQRVVRKARRNGYGSECVDGTFLYAAFYDAKGLSPESADRSRLQEDLLNPALLIKDHARPNVLRTTVIPTLEHAGAQLFRPFYLYPIPRSSIIDLLHGRMIILICFNEGRLNAV